jgi:hypothetical protein
MPREGIMIYSKFCLTQFNVRVQTFARAAQTILLSRYLSCLHLTTKSNIKYENDQHGKFMDERNTKLLTQMLITSPCR